MSMNPSFILAGIFDIIVFQVILGLFGALVSKYPVTLKQVSVEKSGVKFGSQV